MCPPNLSGKQAAVLTFLPVQSLKDRDPALVCGVSSALPFMNLFEFSPEVGLLCVYNQRGPGLEPFRLLGKIKN